MSKVSYVLLNADFAKVDSEYVDTDNGIPVDMLEYARDELRPGWKIRRVQFTPFGDGDYLRGDVVILAQSREAKDTPGTMAALYAAGKLGSAPPLASTLASKATDSESEVTP